jgi:diguanylate cyclase (GGDEF)-like protein
MLITDGSQLPTEPARPARPSAGASVGIAPRLATAFAAVTVLAVAANVIAEHGVSIVETTYVTNERSAWAPFLPKATRARDVTTSATAATPAEPAPAKPAPAEPAPAERALALVPAVEAADRAVRNRLELDDATTRAELEHAVQELKRQATASGTTSGHPAPVPAGKFAPLVGTYLDHAGAAIEHADERRTLVDAYRLKLTAIETTLTRAIDAGWRIFGRLVARQSLIDLGRDIQGIEKQYSALSAPARDTEPMAEALRVSEATFAADLEQGRKSLQRSQGAPWAGQLTTSFEDLVATRLAVMAAGAKLPGDLQQLTQGRTQILALARLPPPIAVARAPAMASRTTRGTPASSSPPNNAPDAVRTVRRVTSSPPTTEELATRNRMGWITFGVLLTLLLISITTIRSIVIPVRQLIRATRKLSSGGDAQVSRGGIRELDTLAVAFNDMALQLQSARRAAGAQQATLERRVSERTRDLQHLADHDALTQLPNRRLLLARLGDALSAASQANQRVGAFFLDLDNFKNINDGMGHAFGDRLLLSVAQRLSETAAGFGFAARMGGDEFTIIYPSAPSVAAISEVGSALLAAFCRPLEVEGRELIISVSIGASIFPDHEREAEPLLRAADAALFRAKALGRSQLNLFSPDLVAAAVAKFDIEQGLRHALSHGEFELVFQPEVDLQTLEPSLVEALVRWRTPDGKLLAPAAFLGVAEESGLIMDLSDWVLETAIATAAGWHHGDWPTACVAINVSSRQLLEARFVERVQDLLRKHRLPAHCIEFELTENVLQTGAPTIEALHRLRACGIAIALDDFGTGYSSFASLELLPLTRVKLDRSLVECIDTSPASGAIASAIIGLCSNLGLKVTAEGVERPTQLAILGGHRATHVQGYLMSRPVAADRVLAELAQLPSRMESLVLTMPPPAQRTGGNGQSSESTPSLRKRASA